MNLFSVLISLFISLSFILTLIYADSNGIWHEIEDLRGGVIGDDEQPINNFTFVDTVYIENDLYYKGKLFEELTISKDKCVVGEYFRGFDDNGEIICEDYS